MGERFSVERRRMMADFEGKRLDYSVTGYGTGGTLKGVAPALKERRPETRIIVCEADNSQVLAPDTGERYLSTPLFAEIGAEMTADEDAIAKSTPNFRFDVAPPPAPPAPTVLPTGEDLAFVEAIVTDAQHPAVIFSLEWCEFCWAVRRMFARNGITYRAVDLDSVEYQQGNRGGRIRAALTARTSMATIPQVFVGGQLLGGATETFDAFRSGTLQALLATSNVGYDASLRIDPYSFLPTWLHLR